MDHGEVAKMKVMAQLGEGWHQNERVMDVQPVAVRTCGMDEEMYVVRTSSENGLGARKNGRILLSFSEDPSMSVGGIYFIEEYGKKKLQSVYVEDDFRGGKAMSILAEAAKKFGITRAVGPFSDAGARAMKRYGFRVVK